MDYEYSIVLEVLKNHIGKKFAIHRKELLEKVNNILVEKISDRKLRSIKAELNLNYNQYICSSHQYGYWIAETFEDIKLCWRYE